jgi:hypothetical protein
MKLQAKSTFEWDVFLVWILIFGFCLAFWAGLYSVCFAESTDIKEIPNVEIKVTFDPSPDKRATGHNLYWTNNMTSEVKKVDLKDQTVYVLPKGILADNTVYKFTATAYGIVNNKTEESVHTEPYYVKIVPFEEDKDWPVAKRPESPRIIDIQW